MLPLWLCGWLVGFERGYITGRVRVYRVTGGGVAGFV